MGLIIWLWYRLLELLIAPYCQSTMLSIAIMFFNLPLICFSVLKILAYLVTRTGSYIQSNLYEA